MSDNERPPQDTSAGTGLAAGLSFTAERLAFLQPRLRLLLAGFRALDALVPAATEPAFTPLAYDEGGPDVD
jgi:glutamine amidotransferase-like uncharacterized protein